MQNVRIHGLEKKEREEDGEKRKKKNGTPIQNLERAFSRCTAAVRSRDTRVAAVRSRDTRVAAKVMFRRWCLG